MTQEQARIEERMSGLFCDTETSEFTRHGGTTLAAATDVTQYDQVRKLVDAAVQTSGRVDVMLNNAGRMPLSPLDRLKVDEWTG